MIARTGIGWPLWAIGAALLALTAAGALAQWRAEHALAGAIAVAQAPLYLGAAFLLLTRPAATADARRALTSILLLGAVLRLCVIAAPPVSTDVYRYVWDGRVQAAGINPYRYVPADPALQALRDETIYPNVNRADYAPTIYPPAAQLAFFAVSRISETVVAMKAAMLAFEVMAIVAILALLKARGQPATRILLYAWHPIPVAAFAGSGHLDIMALALLLVAFVCADRDRPFAAGLALAAGTLVKLFPILAAPALYRRPDWRLPLAFAAGIALLYLPYVGAGAKVFGFLGGYVAEEGFASGSGIFLLSLAGAIAPVGAPIAALYLPAAAIVLMALAFALRRRREEAGADVRAAGWLIFALLCLISPHYAWYFSWLVPFLCLNPSAAGLTLTSAATILNVSHWPPNLWEGAGIYGIALVVLLIECMWRRHRQEAPRDSAVAA